MTAELAVVVAVGLVIAFARAGVDWWRCRTPLERVNYDLARARDRRRRP